MTSFNIRRAYALVQERFDQAQRDMAEASIQSVVTRLRHAHFHHHEIGELLIRFQASHLDERPLFEVAFGPDREVRSQYHGFMDAIAQWRVESSGRSADRCDQAALRSHAVGRDVAARTSPPISSGHRRTSNRRGARLTSRALPCCSQSSPTRRRTAESTFASASRERLELKLLQP